MAKAIYGHVSGRGSADARLVDEIARLRARVRELEAEVAALHELLAEDVEREVARISGDDLAGLPVQPR